MPAIYHEGSWLGNATDPGVLVKDTVGWTGKNRAYSQTNNAVIAHIENGVTYDVSWTGSATVTLKKNSASGATITSGSTSPLSFTADADYELYFGSSATVTNIMVKDSRITGPTYEPYHESVEEEIEQIYADNGVLGAKNLLPNNAISQTVSGVTFTVNSDGSVTANGTYTGAANALKIADIYDSDFNGCILNGCPSGGGFSNAYRLFYRVTKKSDGTIVNDKSAYDLGRGVAITHSIDTSTEYIQVWVQIDNNVTLSNKIFYPMIRLASDPDDTYQPHAMTNRELTEENNARFNMEMQSGDILSVNRTCFFFAAAGCTNLPVSDRGCLVQMIYNTVNFRTCLVSPYNIPDIYINVKAGQNWSGWRKFTSTVVS